MSFQSLIVHNGVTHRKSSSETEITPSATETKTNQKSNLDSSTAVSEDRITPKQQSVKTIKTNTNLKNKLEASTTVEISEVSNFSTATLVTGLGGKLKK